MYTVKSLVAALLLCFSLILPNVGQAQIAYVDMAQIIDNMPDTKRVTSELESYQKVLQKQLQAEEKKMQDYYASIMQQAQAGTLSPAQEKEAQAKLEKMQQDLQKKESDAQKQFMDKQVALTKPIDDKVVAAMKAVATANKYSYIIDKVDLLYYEGGIDATAKLKLQLGIP